MVPTLLEEDGAKYTKEPYEFSKIVKAAKVNDQYIFKLAWKPTWVSMNAFTSEEVAQNYSHRNEFEFLIYYPEFPNKYNNWIQSKFPLYDHDSLSKDEAIGYQPGHLDFDKTQFRGLVKTNEETAFDGIVSGLLDGDVGSIGYYYCIGKYSYAAAWANKKIPGPIGIEVNEVILFLKLSQKPLTFFRNFCSQIQFFSKFFFSAIMS